MAKKNSDNQVIFIIFAILFVGMIAGVGNSVQDKKTPDNSAEYHYAKEKFKQAGQSDTDAAIAAEAVMKFQRAQKK